MTADDHANMGDMRSAISALDIAQEALRKVMDGRDEGQRELFTGYVVLARSLLQRIYDRIHPATEAPK